MKLTLDEHLSPHFTVGEFFRSGTAIRLGIDNNPDAHPREGISTAEVVENLRALCTEVLEPLSLSGTEQGGGRCVELAAPEGRGCRHIRTRHGNGNALRTHSGTPFGSAATAVGTNGNTAKTMDSRGFQAVGIVLPATNR